MNFTPNSFSSIRAKDENENDDDVYYIEDFISDNIIFDLGFLSTAPQNANESHAPHELELFRFEKFYSKLRWKDQKNRKPFVISIDTFFLKNFRHMKALLDKILHPETTYILNDISGVIDEELLSLLHQFKDDQHFFYVYNYTQIPERSFSKNHQQYCHPETENYVAYVYVDEVKNKLKEASVVFDREFSSRVIWDLGIGFSKTYTQSKNLLNHMSSLFISLNEFNPRMFHFFLLAISKKSVLRKENPEMSFSDSEFYHFAIITQLMKELKLQSTFKGHLLVRAHHPKLVSMAESFCKFF